MMQRLTREPGAVRGWAVRASAILCGFAALVWFLVRVVPKPSRASYPCQRAAFPIASTFVVWLAAWVSGLFAARRFGRVMRAHPVLAAGLCAVVAIGVSARLTRPLSSRASAPTKYDYSPQQRNVPLGVARGIHPGRVTWAHDPSATKWDGLRDSSTSQWWMDSNTDQVKVDWMLSTCLRKLTGAATDAEAWHGLFAYYNEKAHGLSNRQYQPGEIVAVKVNLNNSAVAGPGNIVNVSPQLGLAMVRQLVRQAGVRPEDILVYDARRDIYPAMLSKIWAEFPDVRFIQSDPPDKAQPDNPKYGNHHGLEAADWVPGVEYSANQYKDAKLIPKQVRDATYLVNVAILKAHSYPYAAAEGGDEGQTGITMTGKNHFGSIKGTPELHAAINTNQDATKNAYSPIVDLAACPNLGAKTILYVLDGLYCARRHQSYPLHFPNPPFNNRVAPYENPEWPSSILVSQDGVALDSVGLDILYSQTKNNNDPQNGNHPRIMIRENADDYLQEMALAPNPPSKTEYVQGGRRVASLGVFEHWDSDATRQYSRNKDPRNGQGIELLYFPMGSQAVTSASR
jgi:hypothetical protein